MKNNRVMLKPVVQAILNVAAKGTDQKLQANAEAALEKAVELLVHANPIKDKKEGRLAVDKAASNISNEILIQSKQRLQRRKAE